MGVEEMRRLKGTPTGDHLKLVLGIADGPGGGASAIVSLERALINPKSLSVIQTKTEGINAQIGQPDRFVHPR